jgi:serine/threonine-protein kinase HipA
MTMLGKRDHDEASYLDIAQAITQFGDADAINADLEELFRRAVFNVMTAHRDDHMRNHGFLATKKGWRLAPAFDVNPMPSKTEHELALDARDRTPDLQIVVSTHRTYRLSLSRAKEILSDVHTRVLDWPNIARSVTSDRTVHDVLAGAIRT